MPFCSNCGAAVEGRFCAKCGAPAGEAAAPGPGPAAAVQTSPPQAAAAGLTDNMAGTLCYLGLLITGILFLVLEPYNRNRAIRFHAMQAIFLNIAWILVWFVVNILFGVLHLAGLFFGLFLSPVLWLAFLGVWIYMMVSTYQGKTVVLPVIGPLAQQQA
jgi:uncharacterized membrane protein